MVPLLLTILAAAPADGTLAALARVDGAVIDAEELAERIAASERAGGAARPQDLLEDLVNDRLLADEARRAGLDQAPAVVAAVEAERRRLAALAFEDGELQASAPVDEATLRRMFQAGADQARLFAIHFATKEEAQACLDRLAKGAGFEAEASRGLDPNAKIRGGELGWKTRAQLEKALAEVAFSARLGEPVGPVGLDLGFAVVKIAERQVGDEAEFRARREELARFAALQARGQARTHLLAQKRKESKAQVDEGFLKSSGTSIEASAKDAPRVVASAGTHKITYAQVLDAVRSLSRGMEGSHFSGLAVKREMAWQFVDQRLFEDLAIERGFGKAPRVARSLARFERDALARALAAKLRAGVARPDGKELEAWYAAHPEAFTHPTSRSCAHLLSPTKEQSEQLLRRAAREDFGALAREFSADAVTAARGGDLGAIEATVLRNLAGAGETALADALSSAPAGAVTGPIQGLGGWHLVRCGAFTGSARTPFPQARDAIEAQLVAERGNAAVARTIQLLRAKAKIEIDRPALEKVVGLR